MRAVDVEIGQPEVSIGGVRGGTRDIDAIIISADYLQIVDLPSLWLINCTAAVFIPPSMIGCGPVP